MRDSHVILCHCVIVFAVLANALGMYHRPRNPWYRTAGPSSSSSSDSDDSSSSSSERDDGDRKPVTGNYRSSDKGDNRNGKDNWMLKTKTWNTTSANIRGTVYGPARVKYGGSGITLYKMKEPVAEDRIHTIKGYICEGKTVTVMDQAGVNHRFTFGSEAEAEDFDNILCIDF